MAIPSWITDQYTPIDGEYAAANATSFVAGLNFDSSLFPSNLLSLPFGVKLPNTNPFQVQLLKTMLTQDGRTQLFQNPFSDDLSSVRTKLNNLINSPGTDGGAPPAAGAAQDVLETLDYFEKHTNFLSGAVVPGNDTDAQHPTLEKALAVGSSLSSLGQMIDGTSTDNSAHLSIFGSFFAGRVHMDTLKDILNKPDSAITSDELSDISSKLSGVTENDVSNYTVGLRKLRAASIVNMVFGSHGKQIESELFKSITTPFSQDLFSSSDDYVSSLKNVTKSVEIPTGTSTYDKIEDLIKYGGLFEGIPMTWALWQKLVTSYPSNQTGILNSAIYAASVVVKDAASLTSYFSSPTAKGKFLGQIWYDILTRSSSIPTIWTGSADPFFDGWVRFGSISKILVTKMGLPGIPTDPAFTFSGSIMKVVVVESPSNIRDATAAELAQLKTIMATRGSTTGTIASKVNFLVFGASFTYNGWLQNVTAIPKITTPPVTTTTGTGAGEDLTQPPGEPLGNPPQKPGGRLNFFTDSMKNFRNTPGPCTWVLPVSEDFKGRVLCEIAVSPDTHSTVNMTILGHTWTMSTIAIPMAWIRYGSAPGPGELAGTKRLLEIHLDQAADSSCVFQFHIYPEVEFDWWARHPNVIPGT